MKCTPKKMRKALAIWCGLVRLTAMAWKNGLDEGAALSDQGLQVEIDDMSEAAAEAANKAVELVNKK